MKMGSDTVEHGCLRRAVVTYNAFFWVTGPGVIGLGIWLYIALGEYEPVVERAELSLPAFIIISAGGATLLAGLFGCLGSLNENRRLLVLYSVLMFIVCAMEVTAAVFCFLTYNKADTKIHRMLNDSITEYSVISDVTNTWDSIHNELSCCGIQKLSDWQTTPFYRGGLLPFHDSHLLEVVPVSCCVSQHNTTHCNMGNLNGTLLHPEQLYQEGCGSQMVEWLRHIYAIIGWTVASVAASMVLALSAVCCLKHAVSGYYV